MTRAITCGAGDRSSLTDPARTGDLRGYDAGYDADSLTALDGTGTGAASYAGDGQFERATLGSTTYTSSILGVTAATTGATTVGYGRDPAGTIRTIRDGSDEGYLIADAQGSAIAVTDDAGAVVNRYDYTPYGRTTETTLTGAMDNPWRYTGQQQDATGLYKLGIRYYSPDLARFTQTDPAYPCEALPYGNEYLYTAANPTTYTDTDGALLDELISTLGVVRTCITGGLATYVFFAPLTGLWGLTAFGIGCIGLVAWNRMLEELSGVEE